MYCIATSPSPIPMRRPADDFAVTLDFAVCADAVFDWYNNAPCGYHLLDAHGRFLQINNTALRWLGCTRDSLVGLRTFQDFLAPDSVGAFDRCFADLQKHGAVSECEIRLCRADGSLLDISLSATADYDETGVCVRSRYTLVDISRQKAVEAKLRERDTAIAGLLQAKPD
ncbi:MAG: PAS domain-containing protein [Armatimonadetes bacterium]|nr:PAS domain-containing protein [Armatimonadota bacterium]